MGAPWVNQESVGNNYEDPHGGNACIKNRRSPDLTARSRTITAVSRSASGTTAATWSARKTMSRDWSVPAQAATGICGRIHKSCPVRRHSQVGDIVIVGLTRFARAALRRPR